MKIRFIIIAILLGLRLYGADSELLKAATTIGMTVTAFTICFSLIRGRDKRPMGGQVTTWGVVSAIGTVVFFSNFLMRNGGISFYLLPIIFVALGVFIVALLLMKRHSKMLNFSGGVLAGGAVSIVCLAFVTYIALGTMNGFTPVTEVYAFNF